MIENRLRTIEERNKRVEVDKAWETSSTRRGSIAVFTYVIIGFFLMGIGAPHPWINALVPVLGFILSTLTMPFLKRLWVKYFYKTKRD